MRIPRPHRRRSRHSMRHYRHHRALPKFLQPTAYMSRLRSSEWPPRVLNLRVNRVGAAPLPSLPPRSNLDSRYRAEAFAFRVSAGKKNHHSPEYLRVMYPLPIFAAQRSSILGSSDSSFEGNWCLIFRYTLCIVIDDLALVARASTKGTF